MYSLNGVNNEHVSFYGKHNLLVKEAAVKNLTQEREKRAWSRWELAIQARIHPARVGAIENGHVVPYPVELERLAKALGTSDPSTLLDEVTSDG